MPELKSGGSLLKSASDLAVIVIDMQRKISPNTIIFIFDFACFQVQLNWNCFVSQVNEINNLAVSEKCEL